MYFSGYAAHSASKTRLAISRRSFTADCVRSFFVGMGLLPQAVHTRPPSQRGTPNLEIVHSSVKIIHRRDRMQDPALGRGH